MDNVEPYEIAKETQVENVDQDDKETYRPSTQAFDTLQTERRGLMNNIPLKLDEEDSISHKLDTKKAKKVGKDNKK